MKKISIERILLITAVVVWTLLLALSIDAYAQKPVAKVNGKVIELSLPKTEKPKQKETKTDYVVKKNGETYPVYRGPRGGYFYFDKNGKKQYLPKEIKSQLK